jgi:hypothetical protein
MTQYVLTVYQPDGPPPAPEKLGPIMKNVIQLREEMQRAGIWVIAGGLEDAASAKVVRPSGKPRITDGPFAEAKEHVGGFTIIDVATLQDAMHWAEKFADATTLPIEVRAFRPESAQQSK